MATSVMNRWCVLRVVERHFQLQQPEYDVTQVESSR